MSGPIGPLSWAVTDALAWAIVLGFLASGFAGAKREREARLLGAGTWLAFGLFWLVLIPHLVLTKHSLVQGAGALVAVPACALVARHLVAGRGSLLILSRAVGLMGLVYLPFVSIAALEAWTVEEATRQVETIFAWIGHHPEVRVGEYGHRSTFVFLDDETNREFSMTVLLACTGVGAISVFAGILGAIDAPPLHRLAVFAAVAPAIWALNLVRLLFITLAHGQQWFAGTADGVVMALFGVSEPTLVSFLVADKILAQIGSVVVLVLLVLGVVRVLPELADLLEETLFVVSGEEYDLEDVFTPAPVD